MTVAAYVRVSSKSQTLTMQRDAIQRACAARGEAIDVWLEERASGRSIARPALNQLRSDARAGRIQRLYLYRLDRLTRSGIADTLAVMEELRRHGCEVVTVADGFDVNGPAAEVVLAVLSWAARMERLAINERISAARLRVEAEGGAWGRPKRMTPAAVARAAAMRRAGRSLRQVAVALKVPLATVARALRAEKVPPDFESGAL